MARMMNGGESRHFGPDHRVKLVCYDLAASGIPAYKDETPKFSVQVLPNTAHRYCAFWRGRQEHYSASAKAAWDVVLAFAPDAVQPKWFARYYAKET
jgi:hypothetical protein